MSIEVACGKCGAKLCAPDHAVGRSAKCPKCGTLVTVLDPALEVELVEEAGPPALPPLGTPPARPENTISSAYRPPAPEPETQSPGPRAPAGNLGDEFAIRMLLPVGRSWLAIVAGYLGLISVLACPAPIALVFGILAIMDIRKHPEKHGMGRAIFGVVMGVLGTIALAVFAVAAIVAGSQSGRR